MNILRKHRNKPSLGGLKVLALRLNDDYMARLQQIAAADGLPAGTWTRLELMRMIDRREAELIDQQRWTHAQ